jgi:nicotinate-nucleotide adenylyltransferase
MPLSMRAGLFGGTFNPIHKGHLMVARRALQRLSLDRLYIIPCRVPPHKFPAYLAPAEARVRMIRLALPAEDARICLSDVEIRRSGPSYTIDTVNHFSSRILPGAALFLIMGMDAFLEIHTWKRRQRLLKMARPAVVTRSVDDPGHARDDVSRMDAYIRSRLSGDYHCDRAQSCWRDADGNSIHLLPMAPIDISSSRVRDRRKAGKGVADLVPAAVNAYIEQKELYR